MTGPAELPSRQSQTAVPCWQEIGVWGDKSCPTLPGAVHCQNCSVYQEAGSRLFERELPAADLAEQTASLSQANAESLSCGRPVLIFRIANQWLSLDLDRMVEVARYRPHHTVPFRSNVTFLGLVNLRGELQLCASLAHTLGEIDGFHTDGRASYASGNASDSLRRLLVCQRGNERWVLVVDEVAGVHHVPHGDFGKPPTTIQRSVTRLTRDVFRWHNDIVGHLDGDRLFELLSESLR